MVFEMKWEVDSDCDDKTITELIKKEKDIFKDAGGSVENFISKIKLTHSRRVFGLAEELKFKITIGDMESALEMMKNNEMSKKREYVFDYYT
jgi:dihydrodipicolinate synthase/N-acetylneuraminate lyase